MKEAQRALREGPETMEGAPLRGYEDVWRIRVGRLRVLYEVDRKSREILILRVRPRPIAYEGYEQPASGQD